MSIGPTRFGAFLAPFHPLHEDTTQAIHRDLELAERLDDLGYDELWVGEHHSAGFEIISAPEVFIAAAAERTRHIKLGTGVKSLTFYNPLIVANEMALLDHMTRGRVILGCGSGALPSDAYNMGIDPAVQRKRLDEALSVIEPLLRGEVVSRETDWFTLREARVQTGCYTKPRMEMAVTSVASPAGVIAAGKYGLSVLTMGGVAEERMERVVEIWDICQQTAAEHGNEVTRESWRINMVIHCAETREQALKNIEFGFGDWARYARDVLPMSPIKYATGDPMKYLIEKKMAVFGTPDDVIEYIEAISDRLGGFGTVLIFASNWADWAATKRSYELISRYVVPHFKGRLDGRRASYAWAEAHHAAFTEANDKASDASRAAWEKNISATSKAAE
jgi:limonene 1,2-monooxygenase